MSDKSYQMTYLKGPINVTVRLDEKKDVVKDVAELVKEARDNEDLNPKQVTSTPYQAEPVKDVMEGQTCRKCQKAKMVLNPNTKKWFCEDKCWL